MMLLLLMLLLCPLPALADASDKAEPSQWSAQLSATSALSRSDADSMIPGSKVDASTALRLMNRTFWTDHILTEIHYEAVLTGGETRLAQHRLAHQFPAMAQTEKPDDSTKLLDLTSEFISDDSLRGYHRLDRAMIEVRGENSRLRLGRQALTWGNGLIFNPMDLFNPFAPSDVIRDYKEGEDMAVASMSLGSGQMELVGVPRRDRDSGQLHADASSIGGRLHLFAGDVETDCVAASHYQDTVCGFGARGSAGEAAWRMDVVYTISHDDQPSALSMVAGIDRSWIWWGLNWYGATEYFHQGLSHSSYPPQEEALIARLERGETYVLGRDYMAGKIDVEIHPLVRLGATLITNLHDPSALLQPTMTCSLAQNMDMLLIGSLNLGSHETEFGGYTLQTGQQFIPANSVACRLTWHF